MDRALAHFSSLHPPALYDRLAGRGNYPIKFNGSIFTVDPKFTGGPDFNADWRKWGDCYWWQNTRLPYFSMIAAGDFDEMQSLFRFYRNALPLCKARAKLYHNAEGAYFPETMTIFGTYANGDYGWDRRGHRPNEVLCPWWQYAWQQGLELTAMMLDYYEHTEDAKFLADELIPMAHEVLRYYDTRFSRDENGKLVISPTQAVETYWKDVINDTPSVAGLNDVLDRLLAIRGSGVPAAEREYWQKMKAAAPPVPLKAKDGTTRALPAEKFDPKRSNVENPELYALWPFRIYGIGRPNLDVAAETFRRRAEKASFGWQYDGQCAAAAGLTDEAKRIVLGKIKKLEPQAPLSGPMGAELRLAARPGPRQQHHAHAAKHAAADRRREDFPAPGMAEGMGRSVQAPRPTQYDGGVRVSPRQDREARSIAGVAAQGRARTGLSFRLNYS